MDWWIWIALGIVLFVFEVIVPMDFFFIFIGLGFVVTGGLTSFGIIPHESTQYVVCALLSLLFLFFLKPKLQRKLSSAKAKEEYVNEEVIPFEDISVGDVGKGELRGTSWSVRNNTAAVLEKGKRYRVSKLENLQVIVD